MYLHGMQAFSFPYQQSLKTQLPDWQHHLLERAEQAADKAYAPYSHFKVGAALLLSNDEIRTGCNHENASFPAGICAERAALSTLEMDESHKVKAIAIAYKTLKKASHYPPLSPCGLCRQSILEAQLYQDEPILVLMGGLDGEVISVEDARHLLPFYFSAEFL